MATCGIWKIKHRLDHVIDYTTNLEKTINADFGQLNYLDLHNTIEYAVCDYKTEKQYYVSGVNCLPENAYKTMITTKRAFAKTDGILGYHSFQSFSEGEVSPEQAHNIGVKLAEEMWGDKFEVIVSTHINTNHIHNHFVINSVSFKDGRKYHDCHENYARLRNLNDSLCQEAGLSFLEEKPCKRSKINYANYLVGANNKSNYHTITREDIDRAISWAYSVKDFENLLKAMNYEIIYRSGKISVRRNPYKQNIRIERSFGSDYSIENIRKRIDTTSAPREPFPEAYGNSETYRYYREYKKNKKGGFYALYLHYCFLLKVFPKKYPNNRLSPSIRADIKIMDDISKEAILLDENKIETQEQFLFFKKNISEEIHQLFAERKSLWHKYRIASTPEEKNEVRLGINELSKKMKPVHEKLRLCNHIAERIPKIEANIEDLNKNERSQKKCKVVMQQKVL